MLPEVAPLPLKVTLNWLGTHLAYSVLLPLGV